MKSLSGLDGLFLHLMCEQALKFDQDLGLTGVED